MLDEAEEALRQVGCAKINIHVRDTNRSVLDFYERVGFADNACISLGKRLEVDQAPGNAIDACE